MLRQKTSEERPYQMPQTAQNSFVWVAVGSLVLFFMMATSACNLYKSPDRDTFNNGAVAGAPKQSTLLTLDSEATDIGASSCALFADPMNETPTVTRQENGSKQLVIAQNVAYGSARSIVCNFELEGVSDQDFGTYITRSKTQVEQLADRLQL